MAGIELALGVVHHQYICTGPIPEVANLKKELPFMRDLEGSVYSRQEKQGIGFGTYESADKMKMEDNWYDNCAASWCYKGRVLLRTTDSNAAGSG